MVAVLPVVAGRKVRVEGKEWMQKKSARELSWSADMVVDDEIRSHGTSW